jgi:hypothetical protein
LIEAQSAEITDSMWFAIHETLTKGTSADADNGALVPSDDRLMFGAGMACFGEEIRLALEREADSSCHWIIAQQAADAGIVGFGGEGELYY